MVLPFITDLVFKDVLEACGTYESSDINMLQLLLYGKKFVHRTNKIILNFTIKYISETERFG